MMISPAEIPQPSEKGTAHGVASRSSHMLFHAVLLADRAGREDGVEDTPQAQGMKADTPQDADLAARDTADATDTAPRAGPSRTAAPEGQGVERPETSQRGDPARPDPEPARSTSIRARPSGPVNPQGNFGDVTLYAPGQGLDMHADRTTPEPRLSGDAAGPSDRRRDARSELPIMMRFQARASGQDAALAQDALLAPPRDPGKAASPAGPLMPETVVKAQTNPVQKAGFPVADGVGMRDAQAALRPVPGAVRGDAAIGRPMMAARDGTGSTESRRTMPEQASASARPNDALTARAPGDTQARVALEALPMALRAEPGLTDATPLATSLPTSETPVATDPVAAPWDEPRLADMRKAESGIWRAPAAPLYLIGETSARTHPVPSVALPSAALKAAQRSARADALPGPSGDAGLQGARQVTVVVSGSVSGSATGIVFGLGTASGLAPDGVVLQVQTGTPGVAVPRDTLSPCLPAPGTVETATILPQRTRALSGQATSLRQVPPSGSSPKSVLLPTGAPPLPGYSATVTASPDPRLFSPAPDINDIARIGKSDRPDGGPLPAPGGVPTLASQPQPLPQSPSQPQAAALAGESGARSLRVQILDSVRRSGQSAFEIQLAPAELGRLRITLRPGESGMQLFFTADRPETLEMIRRHAGELEQDLRALGYDALHLGFAQSDDQGAGAGHTQTGAARAPADMLAPSQEIAPKAPSGAAQGGVDMRL